MESFARCPGLVIVKWLPTLHPLDPAILLESLDGFLSRNVCECPHAVILRVELADRNVSVECSCMLTSMLVALDQDHYRVRVRRQRLDCLQPTGKHPPRRDDLPPEIDVGESGAIRRPGRDRDVVDFAFELIGQAGLRGCTGYGQSEAARFSALDPEPGDWCAAMWRRLRRGLWRLPNPASPPWSRSQRHEWRSRS